MRKTKRPNSDPSSVLESVSDKKLKICELSRAELYFTNEFYDLFRIEPLPRDQEAHEALLRYYKKMGK